MLDCSPPSNGIQNGLMRETNRATRKNSDGFVRLRRPKKNLVSKFQHLVLPFYISATSAK
jgi:hypothetical protein